MKLCKKKNRPKLDLQEAFTEVEMFQNDVLRPVLKLQNDILVLLFQNYCKKQKVVINYHSDEGLVSQLNNIFQHTGFRSLVLGVVLGQLTPDELTQYYVNESELRRRITAMSKQRILAFLKVYYKTNL